MRRAEVRHVTARIFAALLLFAPLTGCASHLITAARDDGVGRAGLPYEANQLSIAGERGLNSGGATGHVAHECAGEPLTRVEVHRNLGQGLISALTLGIVAPATIRFFCAKPPVPEDTSGGADEF
jgi:hypothetical protein